MTLREFLNRRSRFAAACLAAAVALTWTFTIRAPKGSAENYLTEVVFLAAIIAYLLVSVRAHCPKCGGAIGYIDTSEMRKYQKRIGEAGLDRCRSCGLHLNEEVPKDRR